MSDLIPSILPLNKGLDLTTPKLLAPAGSLLSCLNYEITDTDGLRRIDGIEKYDGYTTSGTNTLVHFKVDTQVHTVGTILTATAEASVLSFEDSVVGELMELKTVVGTGAGEYYAVMVTNATYLRNGMLLFQFGSAPIATVSTVYFGKEFYEHVGLTEDDYFTDLTDYHSTLRGKVVSMPTPIVATHRFRDEQYIVGPVYEMILRPWSGGARVNSATTWQLGSVIGTTVGNTINSSTAKIIEAHTNTYNGVYNELIVRVLVTGDWSTTAGGFTTGTTVTHPAGAPDAAEIVSVLPVTISSNDGALYKIPVWGSGRGAVPIDTGYIAEFANGTYTDETPPKVDRTTGVTPSAPVYYLTNGTSIYSAVGVSIFKSTGSFVSGTAAGVMQFSDLTFVSGSVNAQPDASWDIHTANPPTAPNKLADITSFDYKFLPYIASLEPANSKYEFVNANFYSDEDWDAMYGCNGAGRAFYYDGDYFSFIVTQLDTTADNPRHIEEYHLHLALGFGQGSVLMSVIGEPWNFSGVDGASEWGFGDPVTGLQTMKGTTLGVFCRASVHALSGSSVDNFSTGVISPNSGCIEYSLVNMGEPIFCNQSGIVSLPQSEKYGDFIGSPLSKPVNKWLRPRLVKKNSRLRSSNLLGAMPVRAKNQYRLFFQDGKTLTMTMTDDGVPQFTMQEYEVEGDVTIPYCWSSCIDSDGTERKHLYHMNIAVYDYSSYLYEVDIGWTFGGNLISSQFETNWVSNGSPAQFFHIKKIRLHGISQGRATLRIAISGMQNDYDAEYNTTEEHVDMPRTHAFYDEDGFPSTSIGQLASRGLALQVKVFSGDSDGIPEPPHVLQLLVMQLSTGGKQDA